jgi:hypothetical protein
MLGDDELHTQLLEDVQILDELYPPLDVGKIASGEQTPVFFGSAMTNFGVQVRRGGARMGGNGVAEESGWRLCLAGSGGGAGTASL